MGCCCWIYLTGIHAYSKLQNLATPLSTPASSPCGTKYLSYSNIFFANFKEEQERILAEKLKNQQQPTRIRTNTRLCRETAINNNNNNDCNNLTSVASEFEESSLQNGNVKINETANILYEHNSEIINSIDDEEECSLKNHTINGTLYTTANAATGSSSSQSKKIRITENPLPEPVSC